MGSRESEGRDMGYGALLAAGAVNCGRSLSLSVPGFASTKGMGQATDTKVCRWSGSQASLLAVGVSACGLNPEEQLL